MTNLIYYDPLMVVHERNSHLAGIDLFRHYFSIYNPKAVPIDRTGALTLPVRTKIFEPLPALRACTKTYEDICNERARELLALADNLNRPMKVFYSGGIDSTLVVVSLLKNASPAQKKNITVLLSEESIAENPDFYRDHIRGHLHTESSGLFHYLLGTDNLFVNGDNNDQLFGSDAVVKFINQFGAETIHDRYNRDMFFRFFHARINDDTVTHFYLDLFEKLTRSAPIPITSNYEVLWWINFALKWQTASFRMFPYVAPRNVPLISESYVQTRYMPFYRTEDFQLWSMNNPDKKIKDTWNTYKFTAKDIIYDFTKDTQYRDTKTKRGSLHSLLLQQRAYNFIDDAWHFYDDLDTAGYHNPDNDFVIR